MTGNGLTDVSFEVREGEILGVAGLGEAGGDRLLNCLMGGARRGDISIAGRRTRIRNPAEAWRQGLAYVPGERRSKGLLLSQDIARNVALPHHARLARFGPWSIDRPSSPRRQPLAGVSACGPQDPPKRLAA